MVVASALLVSCFPAGTHNPDSGSGGGGDHWVGTWACGPQLTETANLPPAPGLSNNTLRQVVYVSIGGSRLRVRLSNDFGDGPVTMMSVHLADSTTGSTVDPTTDVVLAFSGSPSVTLPAGQSVFSDPFDYPLNPQTKMAITILFGSAPTNVTGHPGSRTTSYLVAGDATAMASFPSGAASTQHWYYITGIDVMAAAASAAVVTLGDSLTDGRGSTTDGNDRWPDDLSRLLRGNAATMDVAVLNQGIGGNAVVSGGLGPTAVARFQRDVLNQSSVSWLIVFEGINDIGGSATGNGPTTASNIITAFGSFIDMAHANSIRVFGIPITPFGGNTMYDSTEHQMARDTVNAWIRTSGRFDAVIDMDPVVGDPANPANLNPTYDSGDHLHLNPQGYQAMAGAIDLTLFTH
jgi:lysophospholipase L1-like esterase